MEPDFLHSTTMRLCKVAYSEFTGFLLLDYPMHIKLYGKDIILYTTDNLTIANLQLSVDKFPVSQLPDSGKPEYQEYLQHETLIPV